jgi:hypothetical protein
MNSNIDVRDKVERVVLNALAQCTRLDWQIFAPAGMATGIVFGEADLPV